MSQPCATPKCERNSRALCDCCKQNLCLQHLHEHNASLVLQLTPFTDEINTLGDRLNRVNLHETARDCRERLEQWRLDCHQKIDSFFKTKCEELDYLITEKIEEQGQKVLSIQTKLAKLIRDQEVTRQDIDTLTSTVGDLQKEMQRIEQAHFRITTRPLLIDDTTVQIKEIYEHGFDLSTLSSVHKSIRYQPESSSALASNSGLLLIHQAPNLCSLDAELRTVQQVLWEHGKIYDMCWSSALDRFIVVVNEDLFFVDGNTMSIERVQLIEKRKWLSSTCFNDQLFLSTRAWGSSIIEISLLSSVAVINRWKSPRTCTMNERIDNIVYHNETLGLVIANKVEKSVHMELRSCKTLDHLWSLPLDVLYNTDLVFRCGSLDYNGWLVADPNARRLSHITADGKMKQIMAYKGTPRRITMLTPTMLVVATNSGTNLHKI